MITALPSSPSGDQTKRVDILTACTLLAACSLVIASMILVAAAAAATVGNSRAVSEMLGWPGICLLALSFVCLAYTGRVCARRVVKEAQNSIKSDSFPKENFASEKSAIQNHPMRDRLLDG